MQQTSTVTAHSNLFNIAAANCIFFFYTFPNFSKFLKDFVFPDQKIKTKCRNVTKSVGINLTEFVTSTCC